MKRFDKWRQNCRAIYPPRLTVIERIYLGGSDEKTISTTTGIRTTTNNTARNQGTKATS